MKTKTIPIGIDDFKELTAKDSNFLFIDKSLLIKEFIDYNNKASLIIRPRRWGKSLNMSMLQYFFSAKVNGRPTKHMFDNLKIAQVDNGSYLKYQGQHPVIFISFKNIKQDNGYAHFLQSTKGLIQEICLQYLELEHSPMLSETEKVIFKELASKTVEDALLYNSLKMLSILLEKHYKQSVIILIDEYDPPLNAAYGKAHFEALSEFFRAMFGAALKGNYALKQGIMTGILRLSKNKMLSDLNNLKLYSLLEEPYSQHFGFSQSEVEFLFKESKIEVNLQQVKSWYNGYNSGKNQNIYNPWSILNCIAEKGRLKTYWIKTGDESLLKDLFLNLPENTKEKLNTLVIGDSIESAIDEYCSFEQIKDNETALWSLLWALGYLKIVEAKEESFILGTLYTLKLPNHEITYSYRNIFQNYLISLSSKDKYVSFLNNLINGNIEGFIKDLDFYMLNIPSSFDFPNESNYHTFLLGLTASLIESHEIISNKEVGLGRPDILLIPKAKKKNLGIILEFKKESNKKNTIESTKLALKGLEQIELKHYDASLKSIAHIEKILKICLVFYGKKFICKWKFEKNNPSWSL